MKKEKELSQKPLVDKKPKPEQNFQIKITITDGEKKIKSKINVSDYKTSKELHNVSLVDETVVALLSQFENKEIQN